jgi:hypothetical protein
MNFLEYMAEQKPVSRWLVFTFAVAGAFCGAALAVMFVFGALR